MYPPLGDASITCRAMDGRKQTTIVKPVDPFECFPFDRSHGFPRPQLVNDLGFVEAVYRFGQGIIVRVTDAADRRLDPG